MAESVKDASDDTRLETFEEFWDYYVGEHKKKATRIFHFVGTTAAMGCLAGGLLTRQRWLLLIAPFCGYGPAWFSHFFIENNKPATFKYPVWSLQADFVMWWKMVQGKMQAEVDRVERAEKTRAAERDHERSSLQSEAVN
jgi:hypothetical protein